MTHRVSRPTGAFGSLRPSAASDLIPGCYPATRRSSYTLADISLAIGADSEVVAKYVRSLAHRGSSRSKRRPHK